MEQRRRKVPVAMELRMERMAFLGFQPDSLELDAVRLEQPNCRRAVTHTAAPCFCLSKERMLGV